MSEAIILTASDFAPLRENPEHIHGAMTAVEQALVAFANKSVREGRLVDRRPGEFEGIRVSLLAGDGMLSGMRIFGNPPHTRAFMLFEGETRAMVALIDYGVLNSMRVGSIAGVAAKYLHPKGAKLLGLIGSGWQAPPQVLAMKAAIPTLQRIKVFSPTQKNREAFAASMTQVLGIPVDPVGSIQEAMEDADVVDLCAPGHHDVREPLYEVDWVKPGALVVAMAQLQYSADAVRHSRVVAVSYENLVSEPEARPPFDELVASGEFRQEHVTPLGKVITEGVDPRQSPTDTVLYHLEGGTVQDLFVATWGYEWARARGLGMPFDLTV